MLYWFHVTNLVSLAVCFHSRVSWYREDSKKQYLLFDLFIHVSSVLAFFEQNMNMHKICSLESLIDKFYLFVTMLIYDCSLCQLSLISVPMDLLLWVLKIQLYTSVLVFIYSAIYKRSILCSRTVLSHIFP